MTERTVSHRGRLPLHLEISEMLTREIRAGILLDGEKLEPERIMAKRLGIAVGTLRKALSELHSNGMLQRVQGSGNYIRNTTDNNISIYGFFRLELLSGGGLPSATVLSVEHADGDNQVSFGKLGKYYKIRRLRHLNDTDAALEEIWLDASCASKPVTQSDLTDSLYHFYKEELGFWIARVEDSVTVATAPDWCPEDFAAGNDRMWGYVERRSWDQLGEQAEFSRTWFDPITTRYVARWK